MQLSSGVVACRPTSRYRPRPRGSHPLRNVNPKRGWNKPAATNFGHAVEPPTRWRTTPKCESSAPTGKPSSVHPRRAICAWKTLLLSRECGGRLDRHELPDAKFHHLRSLQQELPLATIRPWSDSGAEWPRTSIAGCVRTSEQESLVRV